jgi:prophage regulatory protein
MTQKVKQINLPEIGFVRLNQIIGDKKRGIPAVIPISRSSFLSGVKLGKYPPPVKLSERTTAWKIEDIKLLIETIGCPIDNPIHDK